MLGPYYANQNDATIMRDIIDNPDSICHLLEPGDAFVVDRGFRDVKGYLEEKNYKVLMPALKGKQNQLTTAESNASRNAVSYLAEMLDETGNLTIQYVKEQSNIPKIEVQSRHINRKVYRCFIEYKKNAIGPKSILRHSCECANSLRTIGCCSHVAAVVYYLSHGRYLTKILRPAEILSKLFDRDSISPVIEEDSDED
ncbi:uncharacterized protein LOC141534017 [Cotesia typhae]|uniref:uncharacterized protein LOC141534017 n=1 Tax=Cotesia typhae TaxID=2053667 RepID=UPI003D6833F4